MKKFFVFSSLLLSVLCMTISCDDESDGISVVPHFSGIVCEPSLPNPGDSITLTAVQDQKGKLINKTSYDWTLKYSYFYDGAATRDTTVTRTITTNYDGISSDDPVAGFWLPANIASDLTVTIRAYYNLSGQTSTGQLYGEASRTSQIRINN